MPNPSLCATVTAPTTAELRRRRDAMTDADVVELRLDSVADPDVQGAIAGRTRPVIITCRPTWEGGDFRGSEERRRQILAEAIDLGVEHVDVEFRAGFAELVQRGGPRIVLSSHDFEGVPSDLETRARTMRAATSGIVKIAVTAKRLADWIPVLELARSQSRGSHADDSRFVWIAMGMPGLASRVLAAHFRSCWTYAGDGVAPGQIPAARMVDEFGFRNITDETHVYGVVGAPVRHSLSPAMHNAVFRAASLDRVYLPFDAADIDDFERAAAALDVRGASVTIPYKVGYFERLRTLDDPQALDPLSRAVGAVNTLQRTSAGQWQGRNTDVAGFLAPLVGRMSLAGIRAAVLGAGGAGRAAAAALASQGAQVVVHARKIERAREVARLVSGQARLLPPEPGSWDLLVNATPLGMSPREEETPWPGARFDGRIVYDLVYNPLETRFLREARAAGCVTIGGLEMLVAQAQEQAQWWNGVRPPADLLRDVALKALGLGGESNHCLESQKS